MKIPMQKAVDSVIGYLSTEASKIPSMQNRFLMFAALGAARANSGSLLNAYMDRLKMLGVVDDAGMVCTDSIRSGLDMAFANVPTFSALGFDFGQPDAAEILRRMEA